MRDDNVPKVQPITKEHDTRTHGVLAIDKQGGDIEEHKHNNNVAHYAGHEGNVVNDGEPPVYQTGN